LGVPRCCSHLRLPSQSGNFEPARLPRLPQQRCEFSVRVGPLSDISTRWCHSLQALARAGHEVAFATASEFGPYVRQVGFEAAAAPAKLQPPRHSAVPPRRLTRNFADVGLSVVRKQFFRM
jgi:hypothetical protein